MVDRRIPAPFEGSEGRRGPKERGFWSGEEDTVDLKNGFGGQREEDRER